MAGFRAAAHWCAGLLALFGAGSSGPAQAGELQVYPLRVELEASGSSTQITLTNRDRQDTQVQVSVFSWSQPNGSDQLAPTREILVNPPIFRLEAGQQQVVRLGLRQPPGATERTYRLVIQEVPTGSAAGANGLTTLLKLSLPVFVPPPVKHVLLDCEVRMGSGGAQLVLNNTGNVHVQVRRLRLGIGERTVHDGPLNAYVLPGVQRRLQLDTHGTVVVGDEIVISADTDQGPVALVAKVLADAGPAR